MIERWAQATFDKILAKMPYGAQAAARDGVIPYQGQGARWGGPPMNNDGWWTNGFWPGLMWQLHSATGDARYRDEARRVQAALMRELAHFERLHHDVGFQFLPSFGMDYRLTGDLAARRHTLHAASLLAGRYNMNGFLRAWNGEKREGWVIIDSLMNLPLLFWAERETGDPRFRMIAMSHANTSIQYFVRHDDSCNHIVIFNARTGASIDAPGGQGYGEGSSWSRGQAWAIYGFVLCHLNSGERHYLGAARRVADYFLSNIREDGLTDCDFRQPSDEERIDNSAAACAACGLLEIARLLPAREAAPYREAAHRMLRALDALCADWSPDTCGILTKCTASYHEESAGRHVNMIYGDYFFVEAVLKLLDKDILPWQPAREMAD